MSRRKPTKSPSGVARKASHKVAETLDIPAEAAPVTLRSPAFDEALEDVEETLRAIEEGSRRGPVRTSLTPPRRIVG
jgi:hypothetical protein